MQIEPFILVGGRSTRFGVDKATFEFEGETLAERAARVAETALVTAPAVFVTASGSSFPAFGGRTVIHDIVPDRGAAGAIHSAFTIARTEWIFVLSCDLPFVSAEFISLMRERILPEFAAVVPVQADGRWQPLCGFYRVADCLPLVTSALTTSGKHPSFKDLLSGLNVRMIASDEYQDLPNSDRLLRNVNSPEDLTAV
ncbi:MAG: molybdenum cofactor guanylyltransferase [Blastocatellia bacterium]|nr:molybdenum cofactor guanylyltransferase [Blastocatellia bacterium]